MMSEKTKADAQGIIARILNVNEELDQIFRRL